VSVAILDVDGTLVDTNYQHALAWFRAFRTHGIVLPVWRIHRHIGMGGDQLVEAMAGEQVEREQGDSIREQEKQRYGEMIEEVEPFADAHALILALRERGHTVVLASSAKKDEIEHYVELLDAGELADWTSSADVEATKPAPDLVHAALERAGAEPSDAVMVGDTPWDVKAAKAAGVGTLAVRTGGFSKEELVEAGAIDVYESVSELCGALDGTPLRSG
jgi:HAD superfamily hydrolase (TIGR01509 family)